MAKTSLHTHTHGCRALTWRLMGFLVLQPVALCEITLKQNTETAWNSFLLVSASLAYLFVCWKLC